jgi:hypothetical protein
VTTQDVRQHEGDRDVPFDVNFCYWSRFSKTTLYALTYQVHENEGRSPTVSAALSYSGSLFFKYEAGDELTEVFITFFSPPN